MSVAERHAGGRPSKCTVEVTDAVCKSLEAGVDIETAIRRERIGVRTLYDWKERALAGEEPFLTFFERCEAAMATVEHDVTKGIITASKLDWRAGAWWLKWRATGGVTRIEVAPGADRKQTGTLSPATVQAIREKILYGDRGVPAPLALPASTAEGTKP